MCILLDANVKYGIFASVFFLLFPYIFANSANLLRQYYATGVLLFILPNLLNGEKKYWMFAILDIFIHTSAGLAYILIALALLLKKTFSFKAIITYSLTFVLLKSLSIIAGALLFILGDANVLSYALTKASSETTFETEYTVFKLLFAAAITIIPLIIMLHTKKLKNNPIITRFFVMQFFFFIFIAANTDQAELCERMNIYLWCFIPVSVLVISNAWRIKGLAFLTAGLIAFFVAYQLSFTKYTYYCGDAFLYQPSPYYIIQSKLQ